MPKIRPASNRESALKEKNRFVMQSKNPFDDAPCSYDADYSMSRRQNQSLFPRKKFIRQDGIDTRGYSC
jgi:hypothetical protein